MDNVPNLDGFRVKTAEFDGANIETWKYSINIVLRRHKLESIVDGTRQRPEEIKTNSDLTHLRITYHHSMTLSNNIFTSLRFY